VAVQCTVDRLLPVCDVLLRRSMAVHRVLARRSAFRHVTVRCHVTVAAAEVDCLRLAADFLLQDFMLELQQHVVDWREADAGSQHVVDTRPLAEQRID
jgi:hypothetical protein